MSYCSWAEASPEMRDYHDEVWGVPIHDERGLFEFLCLEAMQCGLSWSLIYSRRDVMRQCFAGFDARQVAGFTTEDVDRIMATPGMIRSPRKIAAMITNAQHFCKIEDEYGSFDAFLWSFTSNKSLVYESHLDGSVPAQNSLSLKISTALKRQGMKYVGPVVVYSLLQAAGVVNDHSADCPRHEFLVKHFPTRIVPRDEEDPS